VVADVPFPAHSPTSVKFPCVLVEVCALALFSSLSFPDYRLEFGSATLLEIMHPDPIL
jgi:hypothetical protein